ncbi:MAG: response regulator [Pseudoalteromonas sp.]|uniref:response regulator n=1 Tax=unclassified Pseudoalteromonas TaxID=194690 RepID=UPI000C088927|nr:MULTISPECIES: response regulator [unclassified Pseudoalteromonas]MDP2635644.1 response regulator [Pseudoalteromonas sp. 1_MG-2023]PHN91908.1 two-component system response regulator [Pseudoalteromonas sp. 3D05]TGE84999.1 two-component system response regulator [Pseudoalteromonas sp. KS88]
MKVLVVDDMPLMRHVLINMLRKLNFEHITEATDGKQALALMQKQAFDLVITDLHMPKMDGKTLLTRIREDLILSDTPVLMVTCEDNKKSIKEIIAAKVTGFIIKPFNLNTLENQLKKINKVPEPKPDC